MDFGAPETTRMGDKSVKDDVGVATVKVKVTQELGWAFRKKSRADHGLDGEIEVRETDGTTRCRLLSVHIERGLFHRTRGNRGFRYRPEPQHLTHWLSHANPVVLVLVDDETGACYWQHVQAKHLTDAGGVPVLNVPREQVLGASSRGRLNDIARGCQQIDFVRQLFRVWLAESSLFTHAWDNSLQTPREFHGFGLRLPDLPGRGVTAADVLLGRPGFGVRECGELDELWELAAYNKGNATCDHIMIGLVSADEQALDRTRLPRPPSSQAVGVTVELVPLLLRDDTASPRLVELNAQGDSMEDDPDFLHLDRNRPHDRELNERKRRANRLWGTL